MSITSATRSGASTAEPATVAEPATTASITNSLALGLHGAVVAAAARCHEWVGRGDTIAADRAAVDAMRTALLAVPGRGVVVVGEGEKDQAPMLYAGEVIGRGEGPSFDLAVDPLDGTKLCATGAPGAISVLAAAPRGSFAPLVGFYMNKLVVGKDAACCIDIDDPIESNLSRIANAKGVEIERLRVSVLARTRNQDLIDRIRAMGAGVVELRDGDVMAGISALIPGSGIDLSAGIGGVPEGVVTACAVRALGGEMQGRMRPQSPEERLRVLEAEELEAAYTTKDLVADDDALFLASGVTGSENLPGATPTRTGIVVHSLMITPALGVVQTRCLVPNPR